MGWFGPSVSERNRGGRVEWYGKCEECRKEHYDTDKKRTIRKLEDCARVDKTAKAKKREREDEDRREKANRSNKLKEERKAAEEAEARRRLASQKGRELKRLIKGKKCPFCKKNPCKGTKPKCAAVIASRWESGGDAGDPANFDAQLRWYRDNME